MSLSRVECKHLSVMPDFDEKAARLLPAREIRKRWPRFDGICLECNEQLILYASMAHYFYGDY